MHLLWKVERLLYKIMVLADSLRTVSVISIQYKVSLPIRASGSVSFVDLLKVQQNDSILLLIYFAV